MATRRSAATSDGKPSLEALRAQIEALSTEIGNVTSAPVPRDEIATRLRQALEPALVQSRVRQATAYASPDPMHAPALHEVIAVLWFVFGDEVLDRLADRIAEGQTTPAGLPTADRRQRIKTLRAELHELEVDEERELLRLLDAGERVERRPDASGEALLRAWDDDHTPEAA